MSGLDTLDGLDTTKADTAPSEVIDARSEAERAHMLLVRHERHVNRLVRRLLGPDRDHEDIVQDVFVRLISSWRSMRDPARERGWVSTVCVNHVRNHLRRRKVRRLIELHPTPPERVHADEPALLARDLIRRGRALLDRLRPSDRIALILRRVEQHSVEEVAQLCGCSTATVKRRVRRAETRLAAMLEHDPDLRDQIRGKGGDNAR